MVRMGIYALANAPSALPSMCLQSNIKDLKIPAGLYVNVTGTVFKDPTPQQVLAAGQIVTGKPELDSDL